MLAEIGAFVDAAANIVGPGVIPSVGGSVLERVPTGVGALVAVAKGG